MAKDKSLTDLAKIVEQSLSNGQISPKELSKLTKALESACKDPSVPEKMNNSRGGDMYKVPLPGIEQGAYVITKKGSKPPQTMYSEESVKQIVEACAELIAQNGKEVQKPPAERKWGKNLRNALLALLALLIVCVPFAIRQHLMKDVSQIDQTPTSSYGATSDQYNYKSLLSVQLKNIEQDYTALLNNYAALQNSTELKELDLIVNQITGFKTTAEYLKHVQQQYKEAKAFYDTNENITAADAEAFKAIHRNLSDQNISYNIGQIREAGFDILSNVTKNISKNLQSFSLTNTENVRGGK